MALLAGNPWVPLQTTVSTAMVCTGVSKGWVFVEHRHLVQTDSCHFKAGTKSLELSRGYLLLYCALFKDHEPEPASCVKRLE